MGKTLSSESIRDTEDPQGASPIRHRFAKRVLVLSVVLLIVSLPYIQLTNAYFLGYDDFHVVHRAAFEDTQQPSRMFTTRHYDSAKYRPMDRVISIITYRLGQGSPFAFRLRNLLFHLLNCALLFILALLLFESSFIAAVATVLFGLNPLAHQAVAGAGWTIVVAGSLLLIAVVMGLWSYQTRKHPYIWLLLAIITAWIGMFTYEPDVAALGIIFLYFALDSLRSRGIRVRKLWVGLLLLLSVAAVASMVVVRARIMPGAHLGIAPVALIVRNAGMYLVALLLPVDQLLTNKWFGTPLVSDLPLDHIGHQVIGILAICAVCLFALILFLLRSMIRRNASSAAFVNCVFLLIAGCIYILPLLLFNDHPSETYVYVPAAFAMLVLARILFALRPNHPVIFWAALGLLLASYGCATWERSQRVIFSANIAKRILSELPTAQWRQGEWQIRLANAPGNQLPHRYGLYTYRGLDTIATGDGIESMQKALQIQTGNELGLRADVLTADQLVQACSSDKSDHRPCYWVYPDGHVEQFLDGTSAQSAETR